MDKISTVHGTRTCSIVELSVNWKKMGKHHEASAGGWFCGYTFLKQFLRFSMVGTWQLGACAGIARSALLELLCTSSDNMALLLSFFCDACK